jgi:putative copper resistance protein D
MIDGVWLAARAGSYLLVLQAAGTFIFLTLFTRHLPAAAGGVARTGCRCAVAALLLCLLQWLLEPAYMAGEMEGIFDPSLQQLVLHSRASLAIGMRAAAMACLIPALCLPGRRARALGCLGLILVLGSFVLTGHSVAAAPRLLLAPLLGLHVLAASFWLGALWPLHQLARRMEPLPLAALLGQFSRLALVLVPLLALAGIAMACLLLPDVAALTSPYGRLLCAKVLLFAALMGLAALNGQRLTPALAQGSRSAVQVLRRSLAAEYVLVAVVLCVTAALTGLYSPAGH